ncbi:MAG: hypothetical protein ABI885_03240 [Gammaproteobacteria bacterium]
MDTMRAPNPRAAVNFNFQVAAAYGAIIPFAVLLTLALVLRKRRVLHGRLMLLASMSLIGPAISRIAAWFGELPNPATALILVVPLALCARDLLTERRVHAVTIAGVLTTFGLTIGFSGMRLGELLARLFEKIAY